MSEPIFYSKKGQRKISPFMGHELLYDYMTGKLDLERIKSVDEFIQQNKEALLDMQKIQNGMNYSKLLGQAKLSEDLSRRIANPTNYFSTLMEKLRIEDWPPALRLGIEASVAALGITILAVLIPWHRLMDLQFGSQEVVLSTINKNFSGGTPQEGVTASKDDFVFPDEQSEAPAKSVAAANAITTTTTTVPVTSTTVAVASGQSAVERAAAPVASVTVGEKRQGELYRGTMDVTNVVAVAPKLAEKITELGGRKAGQVQLGWNKDGNSSYFHFTMPAKHYQDLLVLFQEYGVLKIQKEKHERVMPEGIMRLIITVDEKK
jgi:hypothetical protein